MGTGMGTGMTSRERVHAAVEGKSTDRIASDFRAEVEVFQKLQKALGLSGFGEVLAWAKSDFRDLSFLCNDGGYGGYSAFGWKDRILPDGCFEDIWGVRRRLVNYGQGTYLDIVYSPLKNAKGVDEIRRFEFPDPRGIYDFSTLPDAVKKLNGTDRYFILIEGESLFDRCWALRGMEQFMVDLLVDENAALSIIERNYRFFSDYTRMMLEQSGGVIDAVGMYDDLGNQRGMMISPQLYRKYFKERQREYIRMVKEHGARVFYHSCGGITDIVEDLLDIGVDILDPLQLNAMKLSAGELAERCGDRIAFHGGLSMQDLLVRGTPQDVRSKARELKRTLGRHGRYILSCTHLIQTDVPIGNIEAIVDEIA